MVILFQISAVIISDCNGETTYNQVKSETKDSAKSGPVLGYTM